MQREDVFPPATRRIRAVGFFEVTKVSSLLPTHLRSKSVCCEDQPGTCLPSLRHAVSLMLEGLLDICRVALTFESTEELLEVHR
jgi:hypothetical protein